MQERYTSMKDMIDGSTGGVELQELRQDINSLKTDAVTLAHDLRANGGIIFKDGINRVKDAGRGSFRRVEDRVKDKPGQSIALAFCAGLILSYLAGGRHR